MFTKTICTITALALALPAHAAPDGRALVQAAASDMGSVLGAPLILDASDKVNFAAVEDDRMWIAPSILANVTTVQEARALVGLVLAYRGKSLERLNLRTSGLAALASGVGYTVADGASAGGSILPDAREFPKYTAQEQRAYEVKQGQKRAALAVQLASRAGSCVGPMVDVLKRMRQTAAGSSATADVSHQSGFARQALRDLGRTAYPPDRTCQAG